MLFGTSQKLSKLRDTLSISYRGTCINVTSHYKYLGVEIDSTLNLNSHFDRTYKKATGRLKLLGKLRSQLDEKSAKAIYTSMIVPTVTYNCILQGSLTANQKYKLSSIVNRAKSIINQRRDVEETSLLFVSFSSEGIHSKMKQKSKLVSSLKNVLMVSFVTNSEIIII